MMLAGCPPGVAHRCPKTRHAVGNGRKTRALLTQTRSRARGPVKKRGSDDGVQESSGHTFPLEGTNSGAKGGWACLGLELND